ncbi:MAG: DUF4349 domain-containing protein [Dehalococcoidia bacterium]|nr:DUF4349 domain-containing protein [Dehalococcoidia bacterium]
MRSPLKFAIIIPILIMFILAFGCAGESRTVSEAVMESAPPAPASTPSFLAQMKSASDTNSGSGSVDDQGTDDRKIVRTGSINIEVDDISEALDDIADIAVQYNGYVVSSSQRGNDDNPSGHISIRVPFSSFNDALQEIRTLAAKVSYENTASQDVTEQYTDLKAQLKNYEATEAQLLELLKKAESVTDVLEVQKELSNVRGSIERTKGRIQYLDRTTDMSLIEVQLVKTKPIGQSTWDISGIFKSAVDGLIVFAQILLGLLIWVLVFSPIWIVILVIIWAVRRRKKFKSQKDIAK